MWSQLPANLLTMQRRAALLSIDAQIERDWADGYGLDVDDLLERRFRLQVQIEQGTT